MKRLMLRMLICVGFVGLLLSSGCSNPSLSVVDPSGEVGRTQLGLIYLSTGIMTFVTVVVAAIYIYVVIRFRERPGDTHIPKQVEGSTTLEILWTVIPILLLIILAIPTVTTTFKLEKRPAPSEKAVQINITGYQYWWKFIYPQDGISTANEVHIPVGKPIEFVMQSHDVIHAFWVPSLGGKRDLEPGRVNRLTLKADKPGTYDGKCTELCGASHALMNFRVIAHQPAEYEKWVRSMKKPASKPTSVLASEGKRLVGQNCIGCHAIRNAGYKILGATGPELTAFSERTRIAGVLDNNPQNLRVWLKNPQNVKPGSRMPSFGHLKKKQVDALVKYLESLKGRPQ
ncbi:cytochrome c oxidase subunit 2 [Marininema mesophilum]|uniref:Cytochrome c oxidase subunit 2 n=1 Tax=Marininema mesophilum TaxID=1048340 RepID=A0A1H2WHE9_9BACL|nr:cytochrome c oxidase subunit II [Marininema mesophilum]SDW79965.1 cytochrome c oxidase subunit 2 [Marininema mesophilum]